MTSKRLKLFWQDRHVGHVTPTGTDFPWVHGDFELVDNDEEIIGFFRACVDEDNPRAVERFREELTEHWSLIDRSGNRQRIFMPAVHLDDGWMAWRPCW